MTEIAKAYVQIVPSMRGFQDELSSGVSDNMDAAGTSGGKSFAGSFVSTAKKLIAVAGIAQIVKDAVSEGADYEQNIGGIETLFQTSSDKMMQYANQAYATAGISANKYMEQATSFAAALTSALGNDYEAAAESANMAIMDMSDNANKMGTSIESIQNAYQGFAKQNYTMLDNLKLGYGGTKTEMERLLAKAQEITGVEYNIDNLNDVYTAIHVIQQELGITGTTALEASTTFTGSMNQMKAAFSNLLATWSSGGDISAALNNLMASVETFVAGNLLPMIGRLLESVPSILQSLGGSLSRYFNLAADHAPELISYGIDILTNLVNGIISSLPQIIEAGINLIIALASGIVQSAPQIFSAIGNIVSNIWSAFTSIDWSSVGANIIQGLVNGIWNLAGYLYSAAQSVASWALQAARNALGIASPSKKFAEIGRYTMLGFAEGITKNGDMVTDAVKEISDNATATVTTDFDFSAASVGSAGISGVTPVNAQVYGANAQTSVDVNFGGTLAQLVMMMQPQISAETDRVGHRFAPA